MKRTISILLSLLLLLSVFAAMPASAAECGTVTGGGVWSDSTGDCEFALDFATGTLTISGDADMPDYSISDPVPWKSDGDEIQKVIVENGVTRIGSQAFSNLKNLTSVEIADSVTSIGDFAFGFCSALEEVTIPDSVTKIENEAFKACTSLDSVTMSSNINEIGEHAFFWCDSLNSVSLPESLDVMGEEMFGFTWDDNSDIVKVDGFTIYGVEGSKAEQYADYYGFDFVAVEPTEAEPQSLGGTVGDIEWSITDGVLTISGEGNMDENDTPWVLYGDQVTEIVITGDVSSVSNFAFGGFSKVTKVTVSNSVLTIDDYAFKACQSLSEVNIGGNVEEIGEHAFFYCDSLKSVTIPESVEAIGEEAFGYTFDDDNNKVKVDSFTISGYTGSEAQRYAVDNGFDFDSIGTVLGYEETTPSTTAPEPSETDPSGQLPDSEYKLWVAGVGVGSGNAADITGSGISGKVSYEPQTKTLTLENATISKYMTVYTGEDKYSRIAGVLSEDDININLIGENTIRYESDDNSPSRYEFHGIRAQDKNVRISGDKLNIDGISAGTLTIDEGITVESKYALDSSTASNTVFANTLNVNGTLKAETSAEIREYPNIQAGDINVGANGVIDIDKKVSSGIFLVINGWVAKPSAAIELNGTMINNGTVRLFSDGMTPGSTSGSKPHSNGYAIYAGDDSASVIVGETGNLTVWGNTCAMGGGVELSLTGGGFEILSGYDAESAEVKESLDGTESSHYISIRSTSAPTPTGEPQETIPTDQGDKPTTPVGSPTTPGEEPSTNATSPSGSVEPTEYVPGQQTQPTQPSMLFNEYRYLPSAEQISDGDNYKLVVQDVNGKYYTYDLAATPMMIDGTPIYSVKIPQDITPVSVQFQVYKDGAWLGQVSMTAAEYKAAGGAVITSDGKPYGVQEPTEAPANQKPSSNVKTPAKKVANTIKVSAKTKKVKLFKLIIKKQNVKAFTIKNAKGSVKAKLIKSGTSKKLRSKVKVNNKGVITFKRGTYKKGTYKVKVKFTASGNSGYKAKTIKKTVKIKIV